MSGTLAAGTGRPAPPGSAAFVREAAAALRAWARHVNAWLQRRRRVAADRDALANMSDRELIDIGIPRGSIDAAASRAWLRDCPY